jgi:hypothetical protein
MPVFVKIMLACLICLTVVGGVTGLFKWLAG